jgi:hypothetical protein
MSESTGPRTLGSLMAEADRPKPGEKPAVGVDPRFPATENVTLDLPQPGAKPAAPPASTAPAAKPGASAAIFPNTDLKRDLPGDPVAPPEPTASDGQPAPITEAEAAQLAQRYPLTFDPDFIVHEPTIQRVRQLAAQHGIQPQALQELARLHVQELRRLVREPDPKEVARSLYPMTPNMRE